LIKQCKSTFDASKNSKNSCTLFCAQHSPVVDLDEADARVLQEEAKHYADLLEIRVHLDKLRYSCFLISLFYSCRHLRLSGTSSTLQRGERGGNSTWTQWS
jgi:hypothetical protein